MEEVQKKAIRILHIESATEVCSVALSVGTEIVAKEETIDATSHSKNLILFVEKVMRESNTDKKWLDAICFSAGPGSYTGLRIGASTAKGLAYSLDIPLISVPTLESIAAGVQTNFNDDNVLFCPMIDARRMEVFTMLLDKNLSVIEPISAKIIEKTSFDEVLSQNKVVFCGNGMAKCRELLLSKENALFDETPISAANMVDIALKKYNARDFENTAYFEPFYLKDYIAAKSHVKGLE
ncbi:MAG: tRNA (adenosine(37)-N6)-threonylcarbamoyltransferase complex dimerization subunit type 1 TsaB [Bacteroidales bacterium]|nr:tRNA (adenosine(37)-N6)-threonylcarbamoyltransferase complex dimerization subunit type 1 TsaB [Bacteroidales bacterium]